MAEEPKPKLDTGDLKLPPSMLRSWLTWTSWKRTVPKFIFELPVPVRLVAIPVRIAPQERRHIVGHSPRRL